MEFIEAPGFTRRVSDYLADDVYRVLQAELARQPDSGDLMPGTGGFRKVRWADPRRGKGRRGGLRVIYYHFASSQQIWLMTLYDKDEAADLTSKEKKALRAAIIAELQAREASRAQKKGSRRIYNMAKRRVFDELMEGVAAMKAHRESKITLLTHKVEAAPLPKVDARLIRDTRKRLRFSRAVFARKLHINERTLEKWEQGRAKPNPQAAALVLLVRRYPDTLKRLERVALSS